MASVPNANNPAWDRFLEFIDCSDETAATGDAEAELRRQGIDVKKAQARILAVVQKARAKTELDRARKLLPKAREAAGSIPRSQYSAESERVKALIAEKCQDGERLAYFRKLESVASDNDLRSLLEDLEFLESLPTVVNDERPNP